MILALLLLPTAAGLACFLIRADTPRRTVLVLAAPDIAMIFMAG